MKSVNFDFNLSVNDMINQLVENYKNKEEIDRIYDINEPFYYSNKENIVKN